MHGNGLARLGGAFDLPTEAKDTNGEYTSSLSAPIEAKHMNGS